MSSDLKRAVLVLRSGGVVAFPTETVYGLGADIYSEAGIRKIFELKERPLFDPLIVHISDWEQLRELTMETSDIALALAKEFWPGPLTLVLPKSSAVNPLITAGLETVGIRMPAHSMARELISELGHPIAAPSANKFGKTSPTTAAHVRSDFADHKDLLILDGGPCELGLESTVISISEKNAEPVLEILRPGVITSSEIQKRLKLAVQIKEDFSSKLSPGHLKTHYQPSIPLVISEKPEAEISEKDLHQVREALSLQGNSYAKIELTQDPLILARYLYASLRKLAGSGADFILVFREPKKSTEVWTSIWNRLERAASWTIRNQ